MEKIGFLHSYCTPQPEQATLNRQRRGALDGALSFPESDFWAALQNCDPVPSETPCWRNNFRARQPGAIAITSYEAT